MPDIQKVSATEANRSFSSLLERVKRGDVFDITSHGKVVAEIRAKRDVEGERKQASLKEHLDQLSQRDFIIVAPWTRAELYVRD